VVMVPIRAVAEALGFEVIWNEDRYSADLDNGVVKTTVEIGFDSYYMASSQAIGMSNPTSLGATPILRDGLTYVPAALFDILLGAETLSIDEGTVSFTEAT